jgi:hypothetical protein
VLRADWQEMRVAKHLRWVAFGGGALVAEGVRNEQREFIMAG